MYKKKYIKYLSKNKILNGGDLECNSITTEQKNKLKELYEYTMMEIDVEDIVDDVVADTNDLTVAISGLAVANSGLNLWQEESGMYDTVTGIKIQFVKNDRIIVVENGKNTVDSKFLDYTIIGKIIGQGGIGLIYKGKEYDVSTGKKIFMRDVIIKQFTDIKYDINENTCIELATMSNYNNIYAAKYYGFATNEKEIFFPKKRTFNEYFIFMEYLDGKTLNNAKNLPLNKKIKIIENLVSGLYIMHMHNIIHGDLKEDNIIVINNDNGAKYIDFGMSCIKTLCKYQQITAHSYPHLPRTNKDNEEIFSLYEQHENKLLGKIIFNMFDDGVPTIENIDKIENISETIKNLMKQLLNGILLPFNVGEAIGDITDNTIDTIKK